MRMNAYYYRFDETGVESIDRILCAVASAGKAYHHTDCWNDDAGEWPNLRGRTPVEWIQNAANDAAQEVQPSPTAQADASERMAEALEEIEAIARNIANGLSGNNSHVDTLRIENKAKVALQAYKETKK